MRVGGECEKGESKESVRGRWDGEDHVALEGEVVDCRVGLVVRLDRHDTAAPASLLLASLGFGERLGDVLTPIPSPRPSDWPSAPKPPPPLGPLGERPNMAAEPDEPAWPASLAN